MQSNQIDPTRLSNAQLSKSDNDDRRTNQYIVENKRATKS